MRLIETKLRLLCWCTVEFCPSIPFMPLRKALNVSLNFHNFSTVQSAKKDSKYFVPFSTNNFWGQCPFWKMPTCDPPKQISGNDSKSAFSNKTTKLSRQKAPQQMWGAHVTLKNVRFSRSIRLCCVGNKDSYWNLSKAKRDGCVVQGFCSTIFMISTNFSLVYFCSLFCYLYITWIF